MTVVSPTSVQHAGVVGWTGKARTVEGYLNGASIGCDQDVNIMVGLTTDPNVATPPLVVFDSVDYALHPSSNGNLYVYRDGVGTVIGANAAGRLQVYSDGRTVYYSRGGAVVYSHAANALGETLYGSIVAYGPSQIVTGITFASAGLAGDDGHRVELRWYRGATAPATPTGDDPSGWTIEIPSGLGRLWLSRGDKTYSGSLIGAWSTPQGLTDFNQRGPYAAGTAYISGDVVTFSGGSYYSRGATTGNAPSGTDQDNPYWLVVAAPGPPGAPSTPPSAFSATINLTSSSGANLRSLADAALYTGMSNATITFVVPNGVTVRGLGGAAGENGGIGIQTGTWPTDSYTIALTLVVQNGGVVDGGGGGGGNASSGKGGSGGDAIWCQVPMSGGITINAGGTVRGGGSGGGAGKKSITVISGEPVSKGGGGGGGGAPNGAGGAGNNFDDLPGGNGSSGTTSGGGSGGASGGSGAGNGGAGGNFGAVGSSGGLGGSPGAAGYAVRKSGNAVTVTNNGTMTGAAA